MVLNNNSNKQSKLQKRSDNCKCVSIQSCNLQTVAVEIPEVTNSLNPRIFPNIIDRRDQRTCNFCQYVFSKFFYNVFETASFLGLKIWGLVPC